MPKQAVSDKIDNKQRIEYETVQQFEHKSSQRNIRNMFGQRTTYFVLPLIISMPFIITLVLLIITNVLIKPSRPIISQNSKVFPALQKLIYNEQLQKQLVTVVYTCSGRRYELLQNTLRSFFQVNKYPIYQILVVDDDILNQDFHKIRNKFPNITWISTDMKVGQLFAIDIVYKFIKTEYYFHCEEDFQYTRPGFIERSLQFMRNDSKISQVILVTWQKKLQGYEGRIKHPHSGLSFNPSLKRIQAYKIFTNTFGSHGFSQYTKYRSFGTGAGNSQWCISFYILKQGFYGVKLKDNYVRHIGDNFKLPRYWLKPGQTCFW